MACQKLTITLKSPPKIDLRQYSTQSKSGEGATGKQLILDVMSQLVEHVAEQIKNSSGKEKQKHQFRLTQFKKAIASIRAYPYEITSGTQARELDGIGKGIADRIDTILRTRTLPDFAKVEIIDQTTRLINELTTVTGIGEANAKRFIELGVTSVDDLRDKVAKGAIRLTHHMQVGMRYYQDFQQKIPFGEIAELGNIMKECVQKAHPEVIVEICGSHRRLRPLSGDIDVLMTSQQIVTDDDLIQSQVHYLKDIVKFLKEAGMIVDDLTSQGDTKYMGVCIHPKNRIGRRIDIRFVTYESFYPAILYFTGSMTLNKLMRTEALKKKYTLNEYGLYRIVSGEKEEKIIVHSEREIFDILDLVYLEPNEREIN